jgi:hypothetical protein
MLGDLFDICKQYLKQADSYEDGKVGNPLADICDEAYYCGIINGRHNPIALRDSVASIDWWLHINSTGYFKLIAQLVGIDELLNGVGECMYYEQWSVLRI